MQLSFLLDREIFKESLAFNTIFYLLGPPVDMYE